MMKNSLSSSLEEEFKNKYLPHLMTHLEFVASELFGGGTLSFHTTLVLSALGTRTA